MLMAAQMRYHAMSVSTLCAVVYGTFPTLGHYKSDIFLKAPDPGVTCMYKGFDFHLKGKIRF